MVTLKRKEADFLSYLHDLVLHEDLVQELNINRFFEIVLSSLSEKILILQNFNLAFEVPIHEGRGRATNAVDRLSRRDQ